MPAKAVIAADPSGGSWETLEYDLASILRKHLAAATRIRIVRKARGAASGPLPQEVEIRREVDESDESLIGSCCEEVIKLITADAKRPRGPNTPNAGRVGAWLGEVQVIDHRQDPKKMILASLPVSIDDPEAVPSVDNEALAVVSTVRNFLGGMCQEMVKIIGASAAREAALASIMEAVSKSVARRDEAEGKWAFKAEKERQRTERATAEAEARAIVSRARWEAVDNLGSEYKEVVELWSKWIQQQRDKAQPGEKIKPPQGPTRAELDRVFAVADDAWEHQIEVDGATHTIRGLLSTLVAETDKGRRIALAKLARDVMAKLGPEARNRISAIMLGTLGPERCQEIVTWLSLPIT